MPIIIPFKPVFIRGGAWFQIHGKRSFCYFPYHLFPHTLLIFSFILHSSFFSLSSSIHFISLSSPITSRLPSRSNPNESYHAPSSIHLVFYVFQHYFNQFHVFLPFHAYVLLSASELAFHVKWCIHLHSSLKSSWHIQSFSPEAYVSHISAIYLHQQIIQSNQHSHISSNGHFPSNRINIQFELMFQVSQICHPNRLIKHDFLYVCHPIVHFLRCISQITLLISHQLIFIFLYRHVSIIKHLAQRI